MFLIPKVLEIERSDSNLTIQCPDVDIGPYFLT
jgi:hypothetical protein